MRQQDQTIIQTIDYLKALHDFGLKDYNFRDMELYRDAYTQCPSQMNGSELKALKQEHDALQEKYQALKRLYRQLSRMLKRVGVFIILTHTEIKEPRIYAKLK